MRSTSNASSGIGTPALLVNTRLRNYIYVKRWWTWRYLGKKPPAPKEAPQAR